MNRYTLVGGLVCMAGSHLVFAPRRPLDPVTVTVPHRAVDVDPVTRVASVAVRFRNRALDYAYIRGCYTAPHLFVERRIAGRWYVHERLSRVCTGAPRRVFAFLDWGRAFELPVEFRVAGHYRVRVYYSEAPTGWTPSRGWHGRWVPVTSPAQLPPIAAVVSREFDVRAAPEDPVALH